MGRKSLSIFMGFLGKSPQKYQCGQTKKRVSLFLCLCHLSWMFLGVCHGCFLEFVMDVFVKCLTSEDGAGAPRSSPRSGLHGRRCRTEGADAAEAHHSFAPRDRIDRSWSIGIAPTPVSAARHASLRALPRTDPHHGAEAAACRSAAHQGARR